MILSSQDKLSWESNIWEETLMTRKPTRRFGAELSEQGLKEHSQHEDISISGEIRSRPRKGKVKIR